MTTDDGRQTTDNIGCLYASWGIIVDDIIFPDGQTAMGTLGGGGMFAASGMRLWSEQAALISAIGDDYSAESVRPFGFDPRYLFTTNLPTPRAWQVLETDGRRTQVNRTYGKDWHDQLVLPPSSQTVPASLKAAHFVGRGDPEEEAMIVALRAQGVRLSAEAITYGDISAEHLATMRRNMQHFELFSPDEGDASAVIGERPITDQLEALADLGPRIVAMRQGASGSTIYDREADQFWHVPPAPADIVDVTGAGNAYCGGLLVGWVQTGDVVEAAAHAGVSAAMILEQVGPPLIDAQKMQQAVERMAAFRGAIRPIARGEL